MKLIVKDSYDDICLWGAQHIADAINTYKGEKPFVLGLPTGSTPIGVYEYLIQFYKEGKVSFKNVITFNMDEYVGLPEEHPESYHSFMHRYLFDHIDIPKENINILNGNAKDIVAECESYEQKIKEAGGVRLFFGGIGEDGHIAFNEPGSSFDSRTRQMPLKWETRVVNSRFFDNNPDNVPATALTVGIGTVCEADEVMILANGSKKAEAVSHIVNEKPSTEWTCSAIQLHKNAVLVVDKDAARQITQ